MSTENRAEVIIDKDLLNSEVKPSVKNGLNGCSLQVLPLLFVLLF